MRWDFIVIAAWGSFWFIFSLWLSGWFDPDFCFDLLKAC